MGDSPKKIAGRIVSALTDVGAAKYAHPANPDGSPSSRPRIHEGYFNSMQKAARYIKATLQKYPEPNSGSQETISSNFTKMKEDYNRYEQPYKKAGETAQLTDLLMNINAAALYWAQLLRALQ